MSEPAERGRNKWKAGRRGKKAMKNRYADIIIDISHEKVDRPFTYRIPEQLESEVRIGGRVQIPFGAGNTLRTGYVVALKERSKLPDGRLKEIVSVLSDHAAGSGQMTGEAAASGADEAAGGQGKERQPEAMPGQEQSGENSEAERAMRLAAWMREHYGSTMIAALKTVMPPRRQSKPVETKEVRLLLSPEEAQERLALFRKKRQVARARLLEELISSPVLPYSLVTGKLHIGAAALRTLQNAGVLEIRVETSLRNPVTLQETEGAKLPLNEEQRAAAEGVLADFDAGRGGTSLLFGITGSGKTEVYIAVIEGIVARGRQAIMLIPEIALTYQTLLRFYRHFGERVSVMHSALSEGEKADQFERARRGEIDVIIGPRSALFTPFPRIGVIVIDEEHENSYKSETMPKYHAREVAQEIAAIHGACVLLGSATPSLTAYGRAQGGEYRLYTLSSRPTGGVLPSVSVADLRAELREGNRSILSRDLHEKIIDRLARREQILLFLNRRGYAGFVSCRACGHVMKCPHCDVALTQHRGGALVCHYCGHRQAPVTRCPECGSPYISGFRAGTEQIEAMLKKEFPDARVLRLDADTTQKKGAYDKILSAFANEEADIMIGTQMIVKGHDFPKVTLVGVLCADLSLYADDYRAAERTFQLLAQAAGRAGRGEREGEVVIQTYQPEHYAVRYAAAQDYPGFYGQEMQYRRLLRYPPAAHMLAVQIQARDEDLALRIAGRIRERLERGAARLREHPAQGAQREKTETGTGADSQQNKPLVIGPAPAALGKARDFYRFVIYIKEEKYDTLIFWKDETERLLQELQESGAERTADAQVQFDFDPVNAY